MTSSEFKRSPYMAYNNEDKEPEVETVQPDLLDEDEDELEKLPPSPDYIEEDELNGPQIFDVIDNEDDSTDVLQRAEFPTEKDLLRRKDKEEDDGMVVEDIAAVEDEALFKESISPNKATKRPKVKDLFKADRQTQQKARKNTKQRHASKAGRSSKPTRASRERTSREGASSRVRRTSAERDRVDDHEYQVKVHVAKPDSNGETKSLRAKSTKKTMDSKEMSMLFHGQDGNGKDETQGRQPRKFRWPNKG